MIVLMGIKHSGKTSMGKMLAKTLDLPFLDLDDLLEEQYSKNKKLNFREIYLKLGESGFRDLETKALNNLVINADGILALGGGTIDSPKAMGIVQKAAILVFLDTDEHILYKRIKKNGFPSFLEKSPEKLFHDLYKRRRILYKERADITLKTKDDSPEILLKRLLIKIGDNR